MSTTIHDEIRPGIARVMVHDYGKATSTGRYQIQRIMILPSGRIKLTYAYRHQRPAAIAFAKKWIAQREAIASTPSKPCTS